LSKTFLKEEYRGVKSPRMTHGVTSSGKRLLSGIDRPCGGNAAASIHPLKEKIASRGQCVLDGLSGAGTLGWISSEPEFA